MQSKLIASEIRRVLLWPDQHSMISIAQPQHEVLVDRPNGKESLQSHRGRVVALEATLCAKRLKIRSVEVADYSRVFCEFVFLHVACTSGWRRVASCRRPFKPDAPALLFLCRMFAPIGARHTVAAASGGAAGQAGWTVRDRW